MAEYKGDVSLTCPSDYYYSESVENFKFLGQAEDEEIYIYYRS